MCLVHESAGDADTAVLATEIDRADSAWSQARGLMFRRSIPDDYALLFDFGRAKSRGVHMLFVPFPIDVVWTVEGVVQRVDRLRPWLGLARGRGDRIIELPAGQAAAVEAGDRVVLEDETDHAG